MTEDWCVLCGQVANNELLGKRCRRSWITREGSKNLMPVRSMVEDSFSDQEVIRFDRLSSLERLKVAVLVKSGIASTLLDALPDVWALEDGRGSDG